MNDNAHPTTASNSMNVALALAESALGAVARH